MGELEPGDLCNRILCAPIPPALQMLRKMCHFSKDVRACSILTMGRFLRFIYSLKPVGGSALLLSRELGAVRSFSLYFSTTGGASWHLAPLGSGSPSSFVHSGIPASLPAIRIEPRPKREARIPCEGLVNLFAEGPVTNL